MKGGPTMTKAEAAYRDRPKANEYCYRCTMFRSPHACTLVKGHIDPRGWCKHYSKKK